MIVNNLIPVKQIYLVIVLHKDHSFTTSQTSQFQSVFTQAGGSFGVAESNMKNGGNIPTNFLPAAWWYELIEKLVELLEISKVKPLILMFSHHCGFSWMFALLNLIFKKVDVQGIIPNVLHCKPKHAYMRNLVSQCTKYWDEADLATLFGRFPELKLDYNGENTLIIPIIAEETREIQEEQEEEEQEEEEQEEGE